MAELWRFIGRTTARFILVSDAIQACRLEIFPLSLGRLRTGLQHRERLRFEILFTYFELTGKKTPPSHPQCHELQPSGSFHRRVTQHRSLAFIDLLFTANSSNIVSEKSTSVETPHTKRVRVLGDGIVEIVASTV